MPNGGISLLPEEMREAEEEELKSKTEEKGGKPHELYVPERTPGAPTPEEMKPAGGPAGLPKPQPPKPPPPPPKPKPPEEVVPYKKKPTPGAPPPQQFVKPAPSAKRSLQVSLIPEEVKEKKINVKARQIALGIIAAAVVLVIAGAYFYMMTAISSREGEMAETEEQIEKVKSDIAALRQANPDIFMTEQKLKAAPQLLGSHIYTTKIFEFLEKNTLPRVWYPSYISTDDGQVTLETVAEDMTMAGKQIAQFESSEDVTTLNVNNFQTDTDDLGQVIGTAFDLQLNFVEGFLLPSE